LKAAAVYLERARDLHPDAVGPVTLLGFCHLASGDLEQARREFERALSLSPEPRTRKRRCSLLRGAVDRALNGVFEAEPGRPLPIWSPMRSVSSDASETKRHYQHARALRQCGRLEPEDELWRRAQVLRAIQMRRGRRSSTFWRHPGNPSCTMEPHRGPMPTG
jgi:tetratricopeptide (TPR) repeat protein